MTSLEHIRLPWYANAWQFWWICPKNLISGGETKMRNKLTSTFPKVIIIKKISYDGDKNTDNYLQRADGWWKSEICKYNDHSWASKPNNVSWDVIPRYWGRVKIRNYLDLNEAIFLYRKLGWYHEDLSSLNISFDIFRDERFCYCMP